MSQLSCYNPGTEMLVFLLAQFFNKLGTHVQELMQMFLTYFSCDLFIPFRIRCLYMTYIHVGVIFIHLQ